MALYWTDRKAAPDIVGDPECQPFEADDAEDWRVLRVTLRILAVLLAELDCAVLVAVLYVVEKNIRQMIPFRIPCRTCLFCEVLLRW